MCLVEYCDQRLIEQAKAEVDAGASFEARVEIESGNVDFGGEVGDREARRSCHDR